ncbi:MAG: hypothetical protein K2N55_06860 [Lachnospiraceae bacterium]|nr:hypothetical protein [Lachnospiraceae bacterium]
MKKMLYTCNSSARKDGAVEDRKPHRIWCGQLRGPKPVGLPILYCAILAG